MPAAKRVRWECPNNIHPAVLSSTRPALDSTDRYCMACSMATKKLVKRVCPVLERQREAAKRRSDEKAKKNRVKMSAEMKKARAKADAARKRAEDAERARFTVEGVDLRDELVVLLRLKAWNGHFGKPGPDGGFHRRPELTVTRRSSMPGRLGYAEPWRNRISIAIWPGMTLADAREILVHELTHLVVGHQRGSRAWHGPQFKATMLAAFKQAYKVGPVGIPDNVYHGRYAAALRKKEAADAQTKA
jgi:hypothetical protein